MSEFIKQAESAQRVARDSSLPAPQRLRQAAQTLEELTSSDLHVELREELEVKLAEVHRFLSKYPPETDTEGQPIDEAKWQQMADTLDKAAQVVVEEELDRILFELDDASDYLPVEAIQKTREHRELMIPKLLAVLKEAISLAHTGRLREGNAHFFAVYLLTEFQAEEAFPVIRESFSLPNQWPFDLFGDTVTGELPGILAQFTGQHPQPLDEMVRDQNLNEYVRWSVANTYLYLVRDGKLTRDQAVQRLHDHLRWAVGIRDYELTGPIICELMALGGEEALPEIELAFQHELVDLFLVNPESVDSWRSQGEEWARRSLQRCPQTGIDDTVKVLERWSSFSAKPSPAPPPLPSRPIQQPATRGARIGRNDPCPCGSGKKFKKCCGARR